MQLGLGKTSSWQKNSGCAAVATTAPSSSAVAASHPRFPGSGRIKTAEAKAAGGRTVPLGWAQPL